MLISGHDGGTGAPPLTSLKHAGTPWEIGLADAQQTLMLNGLRDRSRCSVDGALRTGRDDHGGVARRRGVRILDRAFGCQRLHHDAGLPPRHLPGGWATQNPTLRPGSPARPSTSSTSSGSSPRTYENTWRSWGTDTDEAIGQSQRLHTDAALAHWKSQGLDLTPIFRRVPDAGSPRRITGQDHGIDKALDNTIVQLAEGALNDASGHRRTPGAQREPHRGHALGSEVTRRYGATGLPEGHHHRQPHRLRGTVARRLPAAGRHHQHGRRRQRLRRQGIVGGRIVVSPHQDSWFIAEDQVIAGNTILYGATSGEVYLRGRVGERFSVRNSGSDRRRGGCGRSCLRA